MVQTVAPRGLYGLDSGYADSPQSIRLSQPSKDCFERSGLSVQQANTDLVKISFPKAREFLYPKNLTTKSLVSRESLDLDLDRLIDFDFFSRILLKSIVSLKNLTIIDEKQTE